MLAKKRKVESSGKEDERWSHRRREEEGENDTTGWGASGWGTITDGKWDQPDARYVCWSSCHKNSQVSPWLCYWSCESLTAIKSRLSAATIESTIRSTRRSQTRWRRHRDSNSDRQSSYRSIWPHIRLRELKWRSITRWAGFDKLEFIEGKRVNDGF